MRPSLRSHALHARPCNGIMKVPPIAGGMPTLQTHGKQRRQTGLCGGTAATLEIRIQCGSVC